MHQYDKKTKTKEICKEEELRRRISDENICQEINETMRFIKNLRSHLLTIICWFFPRCFTVTLCFFKTFAELSKMLTVPLACRFTYAFSWKLYYDDYFDDFNSQPTKAAVKNSARNSAHDNWPIERCEGHGKWLRWWTNSGSGKRRGTTQRDHGWGWDIISG